MRNFEIGYQKLGGVIMINKNTRIIVSFRVEIFFMFLYFYSLVFLFDI